jgi:Zinc dependent phospholipase C
MSKQALALCALLLLTQAVAHGYSVLAHEAVIDSAWDDIKPLLLKRFPQTTPETLEQAHAYAYGGCIVQDMGYYPFGSHYFSDLAHYVRSGDFVQALLHDAQDVNEFAFALGALAHYSADNDGHPLAVNRAVAIEYPKLRARYGNEVTYEDDEAAHLKTEFGFDVIEVAQGNFAAKSYHDFIGFQVSKDLLERTFRETYGLELKDQFASLDLALGTYRRVVSTLLPEASKVAWSLNRDQIVSAHPGITKRKFLYNIRRSDYEKEWGKDYHRPGIFARFLAFLFRIVPKVGPFRTLGIKAPTAETQKLFMQSFNRALDLYRTLLRQAGAGQLRLANTDFDTGRPTAPEEYRLADQTYAKLLRDLAKHDFTGLSPELRANLLAFYRDPKPAARNGNKPSQVDQKAWAGTLAALEKLRALNPAAPQNPVGAIQ